VRERKESWCSSTAEHERYKDEMAVKEQKPTEAMTLRCVVRRIVKPRYRDRDRGSSQSSLPSSVTTTSTSNDATSSSSDASSIDSSDAASVFSCSSLTSTPASSLYELEMPGESFDILGTLVVVVLKAHNLIDNHTFYKQDPYAQISLNGTTQKTPADPKGGQHPVWDEEFRFPIPKNIAGKKKSLSIAIYSKEKKQDLLLGEGEVDISETLGSGEFDGALSVSQSVAFVLTEATPDWIPLKIGDSQRGEVYLEMTFFAAGPAPLNRRKSKVRSLCILLAHWYLQPTVHTPRPSRASPTASAALTAAARATATAYIIPACAATAAPYHLSARPHTAHLIQLAARHAPTTISRGPRLPEPP
jgi:hypothetical protein